MDKKLLRRAIVTLIVCGVVAAIGRSEPKASYLDPDISPFQRVIRMMHDRNLNKKAAEEEIAGYYEGLLAGKKTTMLGHAQDDEGYRRRGDYLLYESRPNLNILDYDDPQLRYVTNSLGMPDVEYSVERRPRTRRLALLGDSVTRGQGAPFGASFENLLEQHLSAQHAGKGIDAYELLNFSNTGYRLTQLVDVALEKVPTFTPDVYVVCLSRLAVSRKWGDHVAQLVYDGIDLKYPYLRELAATIKLDPRDPPGTIDAKLAPHRLQAIRWAMTTIQAKAREQGADVLAILVPTANRPEDLRPAFAGVEDILRELGVPTIDLLDTFAGVDEVSRFMVSEGNVHPNKEGHQRIFEHFKRRLAAGGNAAALVMGKQAVTGDLPARQ